MFKENLLMEIVADQQSLQNQDRNNHNNKMKYPTPIKINTQIEKQIYAMPKTTAPVEPQEDFFPNILFLKTHKTGSSSIQNILYRFSLKYHKNIAFPKIKTSSSFYYPQKFNLKMVTNEEKSVQVHCNHVAYNDDVLKVFDDSEDRSLKNLFKFTILREPFDTLISTYQYYRATDFGYCFKDRSLKEYLDQRAKESELGEIRKYNTPFCHNHNFFDLGYSMYESNETEINRIIQKVDEDLDLVLIMEKFWESLVFLRLALNLSLGEIISFKINSSKTSKTAIAIDTNKRKIQLKNKSKSKNNGLRSAEYYKYQNITRKVNLADTLLYDHFSKKFNQKIMNFGESRMAYEVQKLKQVSEDLHEKCQAKEVVPDGIGRHGKGVFTQKQKVPSHLVPYMPKQTVISAVVPGINDTHRLYWLLSDFLGKFKDK